MSGHNHNHEGMSPHFEHEHIQPAYFEKRRIIAKPKDAPGLIYIERHIHDEAIVISGSLVIRYETPELNAWITEELESAASKVKELGGVVGHIKTAVASTSTSMISVTDEKAIVKEPPVRRAKITLASIVFLIDPEDAENIVRSALAGIRTRLRNEEAQ